MLDDSDTIQLCQTMLIQVCIKVNCNWNVLCVASSHALQLYLTCIDSSRTLHVWHEHWWAVAGSTNFTERLAVLCAATFGYDVTQQYDLHSLYE